MSEQYVSKLMPLAWLATARFRNAANAVISASGRVRLLPRRLLAPSIVERALDGTQPADLSVEDLIKRVDLPDAWEDQHRLLGFR